MKNIHVKTAWFSVRRAPFQALSAILVLVVTFFVATILSVLIYSTNEILKYFETRPQVIAFLKDEASPEDIAVLQQKLTQDTRIKNVRYVSKEEALAIYKKATEKKPLLSELLSPTIFPASLEFSVTDLSYAESVIGDLKGDDVVDEIGFTASLGGEDTLSDVIARLRNVSMYVKIGGGIFVGILFTASFLVLFIIIGMRLTTRRGEIEILRLIGATTGFIRLPVVYEAAIYALVGVIAGWLLALILVLYATPALLNYFGEIPVLPKDTLQLLTLFGIILGAEVLIALVLSLFGSMIAVSRAYRKK